jgi:hypothetical protein
MFYLPSKRLLYPVHGAGRSANMLAQHHANEHETPIRVATGPGTEKRLRIERFNVASNGKVKIAGIEIPRMFFFDCTQRHQFLPRGERLLRRIVTSIQNAFLHI